MRLDTISVLYLLMALNIVITIAAKVFLDETMGPKSMFSYFIASMVVTSTLSLMVTIDVPT